MLGDLFSGITYPFVRQGELTELNMFMCRMVALIYEIVMLEWFLSYSIKLLLLEVIPIMFLANRSSSPLYFSNSPWCAIACWSWIDPAQMLHSGGLC